MSRKASPAYLKSRMSSFLNPLFLGSIATLALIAVVVWQFAGANQRAGNPNPNPNGQNIANNSQIPAGFEAPENAQNPDGTVVPNDGQPQQGEAQDGKPQEEETIDPNFLSQTTTGSEILEPIAPGARGQQALRPMRLYDQLVSLNLFPDLLPNQQGGSDPVSQTTGNNFSSQYSSSYQNQYNQYQYRNNLSGQVSNGTTPLGQAVNTVMSNSNYARYAPQQQQYQGQQPYQGQQQYQGQQSYQGQNNPIGNNLSFPNIAPTYFGASTYGGGSTYTPTYSAPNPYSVGSPYGGAANPYAASSFTPYGGGY